MKLSTKAIVFFVLIFVLIYWLKNHSGYFPYSQNPLQYMPNMHHTAALKPQRDYPFFANNSGSRLPPEGAVARDINYYPYTKETPAEDVEAYSNPIPKSKKTLRRGQKIYNNNCIVCHGSKGMGEGYIVPPYPKVPSLHSERVLGLADSQIFHIITVGQNIMGAYGPQIREDDRWKAIHYVRALQLSQNPSEEDVRAFEEYGEVK